MSNHGKIHSLPWEIMVMIFDCLPVHSFVALTLTTESLFTALCPTGRFLNLPGSHLQTGTDPLREFKLSERDELLLLLEKDNPTLAFCFDCRRLWAINSGRGHLSCAQPTVSHQFSFTDFWQYVANLGFTNSEFEEDYQSLSAGLIMWHHHPFAWVPRVQWPSINFAEARLAVNRHMFGEAYGLPLGPLEYKYEFERFIDLDKGVLEPHVPLSQHRQGRQYLTRHRQRTVSHSRAPDSDVFTRPWTFKHISEAQIIDGELYIVRFHSIKGPPVEMSLVFNLMRDLDLPICHHQRCHISTFLPTSWWSCHACFTDFWISLWMDDLTGWHCEVATCHRLGTCRSPSDPIWQLATKTDDGLEPRKWRLQAPPEENERLSRITCASSLREGGSADQELELAQKTDRPGGIEGCWAHLRERQPDWKRWEKKSKFTKDIPEYP
ncbi:hypothetical protein CEP51_001297 [Fusarium floridanum]|uniref:F-box domain-containing protein n=1 Tax=Fusarium floridanum TaxID=1325733 RepID=A0A428SHQ2_9HYPO|nr:hypothetical protein CEP51_001297 [Fusarium floridanum]